MQEHDNEVENKDDVGEYEKNKWPAKYSVRQGIFQHCYIFVLILTGRFISCTIQVN